MEKIRMGMDVIKWVLDNVGRLTAMMWIFERLKDMYEIYEMKRQITRRREIKLNLEKRRYCLENRNRGA